MSLLTATSPRSVEATMDRIVASLEGRGIEVFARVDHAAGARGAGLELADEQLLIFGDPRVGTVLMQADAEIGYELPLRVLVWDHGGETRIGYRPAEELASNYAVAERAEVLARMHGLLDAIVAESIAA